MSQRSVEILLGKLVTDEELRLRFRAEPEVTLAAFRQGLELSPVEIEALRSLDVRALDRFARALDPRLQKASLDLTHTPGGQRRSRR
jgi:hypothetical protein